MPLSLSAQLADALTNILTTEFQNVTQLEPLSWGCQISLGSIHIQDCFCNPVYGEH